MCGLKIKSMFKVLLSPGKKGCEKARLLKAITVVVDALRASATMIALLEKGVETIFVVSEVEDAWELKKVFPEALLVGERNNVKIDGFDYSNSPSEIFKASNLSGKTVIFTSTSGARRILACKGATKIFVGTTLNAEALAPVLKDSSLKYQKDIVIVPAGVYEKEEFSEEDVIASWEIAKRVGFPVVDETGFLTEEIKNQDVEKGFYSAKHGKELIEIGLEEDVSLCAKVGISQSIPKVHQYIEKAAMIKNHSIIERA